MTISASEATKMLPTFNRKPPTFCRIRFSVKGLNVADNQAPCLSGTNHVLFTLIVETLKKWSITDRRGRTMLRKRKSLYFNSFPIFHTFRSSLRAVKIGAFPPTPNVTQTRPY